MRDPAPLPVCSLPINDQKAVHVPEQKPGSFDDGRRGAGGDEKAMKDTEDLGG